MLVIAAITFVTDTILAEIADYSTFIIILVLVALSSAISSIQSRSSDKAAAKLKGMVSNTCHVRREGKIMEIPMDQVVIGDLIVLAAGDMLPCDVRFVRTKDCFISQAALTGESQPVEKFAVPPALRNPENGPECKALTDLPTVGFMGTDLLSGSADAVAVLSGKDSYLASIAESLSGARAKTAFESGVNSVSRLLIRMMLLIVPIIFAINGFKSQDWLSALIFSVSIAVGLTPEMLPVIMIGTLGRGAQEMSKQKVIVRDLGAIQSFGQMDVLCTDKTGTLTEDKIVLEKYLDINGNDCERVLRHAYLNSSFQTGLKNLIDLAVIQRAEKQGLASFKDQYHVVDEIPFDFSRRRMSVILQDTTGKRQMITKGAVEEILSICSFIEIDGTVKPLTQEEYDHALQLYKSYNADGLRMLGVAQKNQLKSDNVFSVGDEHDMVLIGLIGFLDPPKKSSMAAIQALDEHGVDTVVLTEDSPGVAINVCKQLNIDVTGHLEGTEVEQMSESELKQACTHCRLFSKLSPKQKERVVKAFQSLGHTVGYMVDGINDAPAMRAADVGISVDSAVDIAKETADIILLEKDLMVLEHGIVTGRQTFGNVMKYIVMATSGNLGNMISMIIAGLFLPFLPMLPLHILTQNLICDLSTFGMSFDNVDDDYLAKPQSWNTRSILRFMLVMGPLSSIFDILCFLLMYYPMGWNSAATMPLFHAGWFAFGTCSQIMIIHVIRSLRPIWDKSTRKVPSVPLIWSSLVAAAATLSIAFLPLATAFDMGVLPLRFIWILLALIVLYALSLEFTKQKYYQKFGVWIAS